MSRYSFLGMIQPRVFFDQPPNRFFAREPDNALNFLATVEENHRRNALDAVVRSRDRILIHVQLYYQSTRRILFGDCLDHRRQHAARTTPLGPKIYQHRLVGLKYFRFKSKVSYFFNSFTHFRWTSLCIRFAMTLFVISIL